MPAIMALAERRGLLVIEDCAQSHGAEIDGRPAGSFGHAAALSFCQDKIITTGGEGGAILFKDEAAFDWAWSFKDHGKNRRKVERAPAAPGLPLAPRQRRHQLAADRAAGGDRPRSSSRSCDEWHAASHPQCRHLGRGAGELAGRSGAAAGRRASATLITGSTSTFGRARRARARRYWPAPAKRGSACSPAPARKSISRRRSATCRGRICPTPGR